MCGESAKQEGAIFVVFVEGDMSSDITQQSRPPTLLHDDKAKLYFKPAHTEMENAPSVARCMFRLHP